jgi:hypothetical protein
MQRELCHSSDCAVCLDERRDNGVDEEEKRNRGPNSSPNAHEKIAFSPYTFGAVSTAQAFALRLCNLDEGHILSIHFCV